MSHAPLVLGTAGHIDHGKTALVRVLTGIDTDRLEEERARGISIDLGFAHLDLGGIRYGIVDVPGHERFIKNMVAGASGIDVALLVVAADDSIMPQTREHLSILTLLGVERGLVAITKVDVVDEAWADMVEEDVRALTKGSFLEGASIVRTSATTGEGLDEVRAALIAIAADVGESGRAESPLRMSIDRVFALAGLGTVVTGTVATGAVEVGATLTAGTGGHAARVRGLQSHGHDVTRVAAGERAAIILGGVHHRDLHRGDVLAAPEYLVPSRWLTVELALLNDSPHPVRHRGRVRLHLGTKEVVSEVRLCAGTVAEAGETVFAQLVTAEPVMAVAGQRFIVRAESPLLTLGGGVVLQPNATRIARRDHDSIARLEGRGASDPTTRIASAIYDAGVGGFTALDLARDAGVTPAVAASTLETLVADGLVETQTARGTTSVAYVHRERQERGRARLAKTLRTLHAESPLAARIPLSRIAARMPDLDETYVRGLASQLVAAGTCRGDDEAIALAEFSPALTQRQDTLRTALVETFRTAGFRPPAPSEVAQREGMSAAQVQPIVDLCVDTGELVFVERDVYLHRDAEAELRRRVCAGLNGGAGLTVGEIKDLLGTSRKYGVPLCEYLDRVGVTRRSGDRRFLAGREIR